MLKLILSLLVFMIGGYGTIKAAQWFIAASSSTKMQILKVSLIVSASLLIGSTLAFMFVSLF